MATRFVERNANPTAGYLDSTGVVAAIGVDSADEKLKFYDRTAGVVRSASDGRISTLTPTAAFTLTAAQTGTDVFLNAAAGFTITLPAPAVGLNFRFTVGAAFATTNFLINTPTANIIQGFADVNSTEVASVDKDTINFVATAETIGDFVELWSDGTSWFVSGRGGAAGGITFTNV